MNILITHHYLLRSRRLKILRSLVCITIIGLVLDPTPVLPVCAAAQSRSYDVVVYGGTAGGSIAAIAAAKEGARVALLEPGRHIGGMISGGLGRTDMERQEQVIGGYAREFFERAGKHYHEPIAWRFEPKVAEKILRDWLAEARVEVFFDHRLASLTKTKNRIAAIKLENGAEFTAKIYIDGSYEGDLMKAAGVSYTVGREGRSRYGESLAGRQEILPGHHQFKAAVSPYDAQNKRLPYITKQEDAGQLGEGDKKIQAYCFRLCLTDVKENQVPITRPKNYDPARYALVKNYLASGSKSLTLRDFLGISRLPNGKSDINSTGPVSTNLLGASWEYPEASYQRRREIWDEHLSWAQGLIYFLQNDPGVPPEIQAEMRLWGLAKDEFVDTGHWPHQLYVREGRRMLGEYVLTQHDLQTRRRKYDSVGMGGYNIDVREVQWISYRVYRFPTASEEVLTEGYISLPVEPYEIPYRSLLPKQEECENLLVTSCISSSSVAYASFRMEPQYMIAGHSAGVAAVMAVRSGVPVHKIEILKLQRRLREQKQIISLNGGSSEVTSDK